MSDTREDTTANPAADEPSEELLDDARGMADPAADAGTLSAEMAEPDLLERALRAAGGDAAKYVPVRFVPALTSLLTVPVFTAAISTADYGAFYLVSSAVALAANVATGWISSSSVRFYWSSKKADTVDAYTSTILWASIVSLLATAGITLAAVWLFKDRIDDLVLRLVPVSIAYFLFNFLTNVLVQVLRAAKRPGAFARMQIGGTLLATALSVAAVWWGNLGAAGIFAGVAVGWAIMLWPILREVGKEGSLSPRDASRPMMREFLAFGGPMMPVALASWSLVLLDRFVIGALRGPAEVGIYSVIYSLGDKIMQLVTVPLLLTMAPSLTETFEKRGQRLAERVQTQFSRYFALVTFPILAGMAVAALPFVRVFVSPAYLEGWPVLALVAAGSMLGAFSQIAGTGLGLHKRTTLIMVNTLTAAGVNVGLNLILVPRFGYLAAAFNTIISYAVLLGMTLLQSRRYMRLELPWAQLLRILAASLGMAAIVWGAFGWMAIDATRIQSVYLLVGMVALGMVSYVGLLLAFGGLHPRERAMLGTLARRITKRGGKA